MVEEPDADEGIRVGIVDVNLPQNLERLRGHLRGIGYDAVDDLEPVNVRLVLVVAAEAELRRVFVMA